MRISRAILIFALFSPILPLGACSADNTADNNSSIANAISNKDSNLEVVVQDDVEELGKIIKLSVEPQETTYVENVLNDINSRRPAPDGKKLVAVLKFTNANAAQLVAQVEKYKPAVPADIDAEMWFPPELIAKSQETGDEYLKGTAYAADGFLQPPYLNGRLTRIDNTNYFVLELSAF